MKQAIILAGGKGTRLAERLHGIPKTMVNICGTPLLERQIKLLKNFGYSDVKILVNYSAEVISDFCEANKFWGINIECINDGEPKGTAGAVLAIFPKLKEQFLVMYGDTMLHVDLNRFEEFHERGQCADVSLFVHPNDHPQDSDLVECNEAGDVTAFHPYPHPKDRYFQNLVNAALYIMRRDALFPWRDRPGVLDFGKDIFPELLEKKCRIKAYNSLEYIKDCGTPERLDNVQNDCQNGELDKARYAYPKKQCF